MRLFHKNKNKNLEKGEKRRKDAKISFLVCAELLIIEDNARVGLP